MDSHVDDLSPIHKVGGLCAELFHGGMKFPARGAFGYVEAQPATTVLLKLSTKITNIHSVEPAGGQCPTGIR